MPMMAAYEQNDARDSARLLASMTLEGLDHPDRGPELKNAINNMYRLLNGYRSHGFYGCVDHDASDEQFNALQASSDRNVGDLREAFEHTFSDVFNGAEPGEAIDAMKGVFLGVVDGQLVAASTDIARTRQFLKTFLQQL